MIPNRKLLIILPDSQTADEFCGLLSDQYDIIRVDNEEEGLRALYSQRENLSAVLLDLDIAKRSEFMFFRRVTGDMLYAAIPVIAICPRLPLDDDIACLEAGASDIITPPCQKELLQKRLSNAVRAKDSATFYEIERMLKVLPSNIYLKDADGKYIFATHYWHHLDKSDDPEWTLRGKTDLEVRKDKENAVLAYESDKKLIASGKGTSYIIEINADGVQEFLEIIKEPVLDDSGKVSGIIALINNVTEQQLLKRELEKRSITDELTGLYNRAHYAEYIKGIYTRGIFPVSFISADCNNLKHINDTYGHIVGDEYIRMAALLFRMVLPKEAMLFRVGGDEFTLILPGVEKDRAQSFIDEMKEKEVLFQIRNNKLSVSFGLSAIEDSTGDLMVCIDAADKDMYKHKRLSKKRLEP